MIEKFAADDSDALLLVDASNAFNRLNRLLALLNIRHVCPPLSIALINIYRAPARLFVYGGLEILSQEGTTQGCPLAMQMYALATLPLVDTLRPEVNALKNPDESVLEGKFTPDGKHNRTPERTEDTV